MKASKTSFIIADYVCLQLLFVNGTKPHAWKFRAGVLGVLVIIVARHVLPVDQSVT